MNICAKLRIILFILFSAVLSQFSMGQKTGHQIIVHIPEMKDTTCFLANYYGDKQYIVDTVRSDRNGTAVFNGKKMLPGGIYLFVFPDKHYFEMIVDREQYFTIETSWSDPIRDMKVKDSRDNQLFYDYLRTAIELQRKSLKWDDSLKVAKTKEDSSNLREQTKKNEEELMAYREKYLSDYPETFLAKVFKSMPEPEIPKETPTLPNGKKDSLFAYHYFKDHFLDNIDFQDSRLLRTPILGSKLKKYIQDITPQIPDSIDKAADLVVAKAKGDSEVFKYVVWWITYTYETSKIMGLDAVFVHMVENYYIPGQAYWMDSASLSKITDRARKIAPNLIGSTAPEIALKDSIGNWEILSKVPAKFTILVFWDPDCSHCQKEIPKLKHVTDSLKKNGSDLKVYAIDIEVEESKWKKFIRDNKLGDWINVNDAQHLSNFRQLYDIYSTPVIYILDEKKVIRAKRISVEQIPELLDRLGKGKI
ncbi:MAG: DUF5106 domain-containing protein [Chitinophagales bacterium]|nr:DUF5106 domain-containing protein [Chitinophagales bacterium]